MHVAGRVPEVAGIHHLVYGLGVVDVGRPTPVLVAVEPTVRRAVPIEVRELHPEADLGRPPVASKLRPYCRDAPPCDEGVLQWGVRRMGDVTHVEDPEACLPVGTVDVGPAEAWVIGVIPGPCLHGHVVDVDPPPKGGLPVDLRLAHLEYDRLVAWPVEVQVGDGYPAAGVPLADVAGVVVRVRDEDVPLPVDHVGVEVVRAAGVVRIVPRPDPSGVLLVGHVDQRDGHLGRVLPCPDVRVSRPWVDQLVLEDDVLPTVVLEVLDVEHLRVRIVILRDPGGVLGVGDVDDVHLGPSGDIGVEPTIRRLGHLDLGVPGLCQRVVAEGPYVGG